MIELTLIALGLAMDCVAVSAATAVAAPRFRPPEALRMAAVFGFMQGAMASLGWLGGVGVSRAIAAWDHWIAFALLAVIGGRMIHEGLSEEEEGKEQGGRAELGWGRLLVLGIATSIDSAAAGVSLPMLGLPFWTAIGTIGGTSLVLSGVASRLAHRLAGRFSERLEVAGGVVLIAIGIRIVVEHLSGGG